MQIRPSAVRPWVAVLFAGVGLALLPWTIWLASSLQPKHETTRWDLAWSGFDSGLALMFLLTALAAWRRSPWLGACAAATGTLLVTDAWFDVVLESHADEMRLAVILAAFAELPAACICFWIAYRTRDGSHLAAAGESSPERDLVGVLEVAADGEAAGQPRDPDTAA